MGLIRLILVALVVWLIWRVYQIHRDRQASQGKPEADRSIAGGRMVKCAHCGTHLPVNNALPLDELYFCSREHREAHRK